MQAGTSAKIQNVKSKPALNGQTVVVGAWKQQTGRYTVLLTSGEKIDLKPSNLLPLPSPTPSPTGGLAGGLAGMMNNPQVQQYISQVQTILTQFKQLMPGTNPKFVIGGLLVLVVLFIYLLGMMRGTIFLCLFGTAFQLGMPAYKTAGGGKAGVQASVQAIGTKASTTIQQKTGYTVSAKQAMLGIGVLLFLVFKLTAPSAATSYARPPSVNTDESNEEELDDEDEEFFAKSETLYSWEDMTKAYSFGIRKQEMDLDQFTKDFQKKTQPKTEYRQSSSTPPPHPSRTGAPRAASGFGFVRF